MNTTRHGFSQAKRRSRRFRGNVCRRASRACAPTGLNRFLNFTQGDVRDAHLPCAVAYRAFGARDSGYRSVLRPFVNLAGAGFVTGFFCSVVPALRIHSVCRAQRSSVKIRSGLSFLTLPDNFRIRSCSLSSPNGAVSNSIGQASNASAALCFGGKIFSPERA